MDYTFVIFLNKFMIMFPKLKRSKKSGKNTLALSKFSVQIRRDVTGWVLPEITPAASINSLHDPLRVVEIPTVSCGRSTLLYLFSGSSQYNMFNVEGS